MFSALFCIYDILQISKMPNVSQIQETALSEEEGEGGDLRTSTYGLSPYRRRMFAVTGRPGMGPSSQVNKVLAQVAPLDLIPMASSVTLATRVRKL